MRLREKACSTSGWAVILNIYITQHIMRYILGAIIIVAAGFFLWSAGGESAEAPGATSYKDATYTISGEPVTLVNGVAETEAAPGSASKIVTRYWGNEVRTDVNADGKEDVVFLLTQETGGSGIFYYAAAALGTETGYEGTHALFIGDRIAPQTTEINERGFVVVNYAERLPGESFAIEPSMGKSLYLKFDPDTLQFGEVVQNFEGEADPSVMRLDMKTWTWVNTLYNDGTKITPKDATKFALTFKSDGTFSAKTDCNGVGGKYAVNGTSIGFSEMMSTLMYCEGSQEAAFTKTLTQVKSYHFTSKGELVFDLAVDSGTATFR